MKVQTIKTTIFFLFTCMEHGWKEGHL